MKISSIGIDYMDDAEGRAIHEYPDSEGNPTIGIGHLLTRSELTSGKIVIGSEVIKYRIGLTDKQMNDLFLQDMEPVMSVINGRVKVPLTQYQFDSICSFVFNVGNGAFITSTLLKKLNMGGYNEVPYQLSRWVKSRNKSSGRLEVNKGLVNRRISDILLWNNQWRILY